jgi:hypothetical protein
MKDIAGARGSPLAMQVQRTLVKSPPEIWAEVSDVETLARHLGEFGEIAITRVEPETKVAWEGEHASGTVELTASGWGTKVTLTAEATATTPPEPEPAAAAPAEPEPEAAAPAEPEPEPVVSEPQAGSRPRRRWLRFWRRPVGVGPTPPTPGPAPGPPAPPGPDPSPPTPTPQPGPPGPPDPTPPQIRVAPGDPEAVLVKVLDDLGQAHHRPFSR